MTNMLLCGKIPMSATVLPADFRKEDSNMNQKQITFLHWEFGNKGNLAGKNGGSLFEIVS